MSVIPRQRSALTRGRGLKPAPSAGKPIARAARVHAPRLLSPISPGEILSEEFLAPLGISQNALARAIGVPPARVNDLVHGRRTVTADTAVRLSLFLGTSVDFWINLQAHHDARVARRDLAPRLSREIEPFVPRA